MSNKAKLADAYRRWHDTRGANAQEWIEMCAENIQFGSLAEGARPIAFTARIEGRSLLKSYFDGLTSQWTMIHYTVHHMIEEGDRVAVVSTTAWTNKATGKVAESPKVDIWQFDKDGRASSFYEYYDTAKFMAAATA